MLLFSSANIIGWEVVKACIREVVWCSPVMASDIEEGSDCHKKKD